MIDIKELNKGAIASGRLSEVHIHNLRTYPFLVFNGLDTVEINFNIEPLLLDKQDGAYVEYVLRFKDKVPKKMSENSKMLMDMVKVLLWKEVRVDVAYRKNKELVYVGKEHRNSSSSGTKSTG